MFDGNEMVIYISMSEDQVIKDIFGEILSVCQQIHPTPFSAGNGAICEKRIVFCQIKQGYSHTIFL